MSWDIFVQDFPNVEKISDIPDDFVPNSIGTRADIIAKILGSFPSANFNDPSWGVIETHDGSIEVNIGNNDDCDGFMLHVRGGKATFEAVTAIVTAVGCRAIDCQTSEFFEIESGRASFSNWQDYRDQVVSAYEKPTKPSFWTRFRRLWD
jgi:hypothetical protein